MAGRLLIGALVALLATQAVPSLAGEKAASPVRYLPLDAPQGMSQAVVVRNCPLVYTRQLLPLDRERKLVGEGSADQQIEQTLNNLDAVLRGARSGLDKLVRLNVYSLSHTTADRVRELLSKRLGPTVRPAITIVLTPLPHRKALVAVDAIALAAAPTSVSTARRASGLELLRCTSVTGDRNCADAAVLSKGGVAYLSGQPDRGSLTTAAVSRSLSALIGTLGQLNLTPARVVQVRVFLAPASSADEVMHEVKKFFPGPLTPPVVFVEWLASAPVEIELIAQLPEAGTSPAGLQYYNPPDLRPSPVFSRVAMVRSEQQIFISGLFSRTAGDAEVQARDVFAQLKTILAATGGDMNHLAKASYFVSDDPASTALDKVRTEFLVPERPPAASKVTVHGVGRPGRTVTMDMIGVSAK